MIDAIFHTFFSLFRLLPYMLSRYSSVLCYHIVKLNKKYFGISLKQIHSLYIFHLGKGVNWLIFTEMFYRKQFDFIAK